MSTESNQNHLGQTKLFDAEKLHRYLERTGSSMSPERPLFAAWEKPYYRFSLVTPDAWKDNMSISDVMEYLTANGLLDDSDIIQSWTAHEQWYTELQIVFKRLLDDLYPGYVALPYYELYPKTDWVSDEYVYCGDAVLKEFIEILLVMSDVSVLTDSMESQQIIMDNAVGFVVNELIPSLYSESRVSRETANALMQKVYEHMAKLWWIYCLI